MSRHLSQHPAFIELASGKHCQTNRYFVTSYGWKVARLFSRLDGLHFLRLEGRPAVFAAGRPVFRPAMALFTANDAVLPFPLRQAPDRVDTQLDLLIYDAFPLPKASKSQLNT